MAKHVLVVIENATINRMLRDQRFLDEFGFMKSLAAALSAEGKKPGGCGCNRSKQAISREQYAEISQSIGAMGDDRKVKLKQLLDTQQARVVYRGHNGKTIRLTF